MRILIISIFVSVSAWSTAQTLCDSLEIMQVNVDAFYSDRINLKVDNSSNEILSYPGFRIYDENSNLIGEEEVWFFGLSGESNHIVEFNPTLFQFEPLEMYNLTIELWINFYDELICSYNLTSVILPQPIDCVNVGMTFSEFSTEQASYQISLTDVMGNEIHSETLLFQPNVGIIERFFCLPPSCFELTATTDIDSEFSHLNVNLEVIDSFGFLFSELLNEQQVNSIQFGIWSDCSILSASNNHLSAQPILFPNPVQDQLQFKGTFDYHITIFNALGQCMTVKSFEESELKTMNVSSFTPGIYHILLTGSDHRFTMSFIKE